MYRNLDSEILRLIEEQPEISERDIANALSVPEEQVKAHISCFQDTREKILIMNAEISAFETLRKELEAEDYNVIKASDSLETSDNSEALNSFSIFRQLKVEKPDLVLLDQEFLGLDGFEICRQLKADTLYWHLPIVMLSEEDDIESVIRSFEMGADDCVMKPFNLKELKARIRAILRRNMF